jgi:hypothetical protein
MEYQTTKENFEETLAEARRMTKQELNAVLQDRLAMHNWAVRAYEQALQERETNLEKRQSSFQSRSKKDRSVG